MAERRMFAKSIVLSDAFLDMPMSARCLYFTLSMFADDDGFIGSPKGIMRQCGASDDDLQVLLAKRFVLGFESGVIVVKHWRINNYLQNDRHKETTYIEELESLELDGKQAYVEKEKKQCIQNVYKMYTQDSIVKDSIVKDSVVDDNQNKNKVYGICNNVNLSDEEFEKLKKAFPKDYQYRINRLSTYMSEHNKTYKNHYATIVMWAESDKKKAKNTQTHFENEREYSDEELDAIQYRDE